MISLLQNGSSQLKDEEALKLQLDYAWKWFSYHAAQRVSMFNYFLIVTGILANAYISALKDGFPWIASAIGVMGCFISFAFCRLDCRNWCLVKMGEEALEVFERYHLFTEELKATDGHTGQVFPGAILFREASEDKETRGNAAYNWARNCWKGQHKVWLRLIEGVVALTFLGAAVAAYHLAHQ
jgi:hypothetical protein